MVNKTLGNHFEAEFCEMLAAQGFWAHNMAQNQTGQPADVIATRNDHPVLVDCKVCSDNRFPLSRIEPNQEGAMDFWEQQGNTGCYFALKLTDGAVYMAPYDDLLMYRLHGGKTLCEKDIRGFPTFDQWVEGLP